MVEPVDEKKKQEVTAQFRGDKWKNYLLLFLAALCGFFVWYYFKRDSFVLEMDGFQILIAIAMFMLTAFWLLKKEEQPKLPEKYTLSRIIAEWHFTNFGTYLDYTECEMERLSEIRALVYFPRDQKTFEFEAGMGVMGERWKDIEEKTIADEQSELIKAYAQRKSKDEDIDRVLRAKGLVRSED